jgi:LuxR family transcriptional regulator, quorum-sensing system regulator BjaR1
VTAMTVDHARSAFDLLDDFDHIETREEVTDRLGATFSGFGYSAFLITGVPEPPTPVEPCFILNGLPAAYSKHYVSENFYPDDPVAARCRRATDPFEWSEASYDPGAWPRAAEVMNTAAAFGLRQGYCVPIKRGNGLSACVTLAGERPDLGTRAKRAIHLISIYAYQKAVSVLGPVQARRTDPRLLTHREREVLIWSAQGKSSWEISVILGVSERTVNWFIANASRKLDAVNRTQAVVNAIRSGEIEI